MKKRDIEMLVARCDHTWYTMFIDIPANTMESDIERKAVADTTEMLEGEDVALVAVYHIPNYEEDDS